MGFIYRKIQIILIAGYLMMAAACGQTEPTSSIETNIWKVEQVDSIGGVQSEILGTPNVISDTCEVSLAFDGVDDGIILPVNPIEGLKQFTIEVLFKPDSDGPDAQRFVHFQDEVSNRGLFEIRLMQGGDWALDTFLYNSKTGKRLVLLDRELLHPGGQWYWVALIYDGKTMSHYVNGEKGMEGDIGFGPMSSGKISLGVRLNQVSWYKGLIGEIRFHTGALSVNNLQRSKKNSFH